MAGIQDYELLVSGLGGNVYIAKKTKQTHVMSSNRKLIDKSDFINVLLNWTVTQLKNGSNTLQITTGDTVTAEIIIKDKSIIK